MIAFAIVMVFEPTGIPDGETIGAPYIALDSINVPEVLGAFFAVVPVWFGWSRLDAEKFADIAGSAGVAALIGANPLLGLIALVATARSFNLLLARQRGSLRNAVGSGALGAVQTSVVYAASAAIGGHAVIGGLQEKLQFDVTSHPTGA